MPGYLTSPIPPFSYPRRAIAWQTPAFTAEISAIAASRSSRGTPASSARWIRLALQGSHVFVNVTASPMNIRSRSVSSGALLALA
jgi:hypothetical protein